MASTQNMNKFFKEFMASLPMDTSAFEDAVKKQTVVNEKYYNLFLGAAEKSTAISYKWAFDVLTKVQEVQTSKTDPSGYAQSIEDFVSEQSDVATENLAALAEIANKAQLDSVSLFVATAKEVKDETAASVKKAANDIASAQKKA
jgi:predicted phage tail protein